MYVDDVPAVCLFLFFFCLISFGENTKLEEGGKGGEYGALEALGTSLRARYVEIGGSTDVR